MAKVKIIKTATIKIEGNYSKFKKDEQLDLQDNISDNLISGGYAELINEIVPVPVEIVEKPKEKPQKPKKGKMKAFQELMEKK